MDDIRESFYQLHLEKLLGGGHLVLGQKETDITTADFHAEIKYCTAWTCGIKQLKDYQRLLPKRELRLYLFGKKPVEYEYVVEEILNQDILVYGIYHKDKKVLVTYNFKDKTETEIEIEKGLDMTIFQRKTHTCPRCGYKTINACDMKKHLKRVEICQPLLANNDLNDYKRNFLMPKTAVYKCKGCTKSFSSRSGYTYHVALCNQDGDFNENEKATQTDYTLSIDERFQQLENKVDKLMSMFKLVFKTD